MLALVGRRVLDAAILACCCPLLASNENKIPVTLRITGQLLFLALALDLDYRFRCLLLQKNCL